MFSSSGEEAAPAPDRTKNGVHESEFEDSWEEDPQQDNIDQKVYRSVTFDIASGQPPNNEKLNDLGHNDQITCIAMSSPEEGSEVVNHMESYCEDTYMSPMPSLQEIFPYDSNVQQTSERRGNEEITLITDYHVEDRRKSEVQFDFAIISGENGYGVLTVFDNASSTTLIL